MRMSRVLTVQCTGARPNSRPLTLQPGRWVVHTGMKTSDRQAAQRIADGCDALDITHDQVSGPRATDHAKSTLLGLASTEQQRGKQITQHLDTIQQLHVAVQPLHQVFQQAQQQSDTATSACATVAAAVEELDTQLAELSATMSDDVELHQARSAVGQLTRRQLDELRKLHSPPETVRRVVELVSSLLAVQQDWSSSSYRQPDWASSRRVLAKADLVTSILHFDPTVALCDADGFVHWVQEHFLQGDQALTIEKVRFSSVVCQALFQWSLSQLAFAQVLRERRPLRLQIAECTKRRSGLAKEESACAEAAADAVNSLQRASEDVAAAENELTASKRKIEQLRAELDVLIKAAIRLLQGSPEVVHATLAAVEVELTERISFCRNGTVLTDVCLAPIRGVLQALDENPTLKLCIEGHARSTEENPAKLAQARADAVRNQLVECGVPAARLRARGLADEFGEGSHCEFKAIQEIRISGSVTFGACSCDLSSECFALLDEVAAVITARAQLHMRVEGHTDSAYAGFIDGGNLQLSKGRAEAVVEYLAAMGVPKSQLVPVGWGEDLPIAPNDTRDNKATNRRVEFHLMPQESQRGISALLKDPEARERLTQDPNAVEQLRAIATGASGVADKAVRRAAAGVVVACGATWYVERLLWIAVHKEKSIDCQLRQINPDVIRLVMQWFVMSGAQ